MLIHLDARRDIMKAGSPEQTLLFCADHFAQVYKESLSLHGSFSVALSGGSTPKALFSLLTKEPYVSKFDWSKVFLFWSDERAVAPEDPDSNFHMAMEAGFSHVPIPKSHIHRMIAETDIEQNALNYETLIQAHLKGRGFDLVMLGMGEDGHTASLFPGTEGLNVKGRLVIANYVPQKNTWRMTLTFECINKARNIAIYVLGRSKQEMLKESLSGKGLYPIENIGTERNRALWIVDDQAGSLFPLR
jgi:6-phosphogluconolactonase